LQELISGNPVLLLFLVLGQSKAYPNPAFSLAAGRGRPRDGGDSRPENAILLVQPIELSGIRRWRARTSELRLRGVEVDRVLAETVVDSTVSRLVYAVLLERRRAQIADESAEVAHRLHETLDRRAELGESSPLEAVKARSEWFARRRDVITAKSTLAAARSALELFCGNRLPDSYEIADRLQGSRAIPLPPDLVRRLRTRNPVLLRAGVAVEIRSGLSEGESIVVSGVFTLKSEVLKGGLEEHHAGVRQPATAGERRS
jgi:cobalt-zinc-cadmium efflux system outer membrane protein